MTSLYERNQAVGIEPWSAPYGGTDYHFEAKRYHDGYYADGAYRGQQVKDVIDLFHGVLGRIIRPDHPRLQTAEEEARAVGVEHIGKTSLHEHNVAFLERVKARCDELGLGKYRVIPATNGSIANNMAFRLAYGYTRKGEPLYLEGCYHGSDFLGNAMVNAPGWRGEDSPSIATRMPGLSPSMRYFELRNFTTLQMQLGEIRLRVKKIFPFAEDIQGVNGFVNPGEDFLTNMVLGLNEGDAFINDEVQTSMRRGSYLSVPAWLSRESGEVKAPIIITASKAVANGAGGGFVAVPEVIADDVKQNLKTYGLHWDTFDRNQRTARLASEVHDIFHDEKLGERTPEVRETFLDQVRPIQDERPDVLAEIRGDGLMIGLRLNTAAQVNTALEKCIEYGVMVGKGSDALRIAPLADMPLDLVREAGKRVANLLASLPKAA